MEKRGTPWRYGWLLWLGISQRYRGGELPPAAEPPAPTFSSARALGSCWWTQTPRNEQALHFFRDQGFATTDARVSLRKFGGASQLYPTASPQVNASVIRSPATARLTRGGGKKAL